MLITITNKFLTATINTLGAELVSLEKNQVNYIWEVDENYWNKTSPVLFPIVGRLKNDVYTLNGKEYTLPRHGFARNYEFQYELKAEHQVVFELESNAETKYNFPFDFKLFLAYTLIDSELIIEYFVRNLSEETLPFSIGAHPAFAIEGDIADYSLQFNKPDVLITHHLENENFNFETSVVESHSGKLDLKYDLFKNDALVFESLESDEVILQHLDVPVLKVTYEYFPYLGIWTKPNAPFLCIEPWCGVADNTIHDGNILEKEGIQLLPAGEDFLRAIRIEILR
ncbi:Probable Aldose 1-epimerase [Flavobacterium indicum GPTSA100-9 = DSM 17447]|uniref:Probable Aldose 1-epimerase n=1 Tax=Flavobacterium indicum (strain DSM 17447 / CIP 109464 / GPTSA100-9) TaxID=1094466 RepID=H8XVE3_FLAIG|nr:aldose 1-epimerase family protein [Flavobacterium indicum]CCG53113.1 Probable Aldose 1-epimerase [Flavobacterium indicum GPTSA100-9 = DSM 17447]